jgi:succinate dehydrogenase / fumarate reductase cytochrome b subunit
MNWLSDFFSSTIGRKVVMALTGLFLILFLVVHLIGNLQLLHSDEGRAFNLYAKFMTSNPLIVTISIVNFGFIFIHIIWAAILTRRNRAARGPVGYAVNRNSSTATSRNMGILGTLILIFLVIHLRGFWYQTHFGDIPRVDYDGVEAKNLFAVVNEAYSQVWYVVVYVVSMAVVGFHLYHGFGSAFQTLGLNHVKYNAIVRFAGVAFSIVVPLLFALIPILMYFDLTVG